MHAARWRPPAGSRWFPLLRRGKLHGWALDEGRHDLDPEDPSQRARCDARWRAAEPLVLRGALRPGVRALRAPIRDACRLFERLRRGADFQDELWRRPALRRAFLPGGTTIDLSDAREIEKVFAHARHGKGSARGASHARDLYAKLSWIAHDERDSSLRIRFSFGAEQLYDWQHETARAPHADRLAEALFPECAALTEATAVVRLIERQLGQKARFSERIVYNNAPGGGATLHHDAEPGQHGVLFGQLAGRTAWLALPKRALARALVDHGLVRTVRAGLRLLDREAQGELAVLLERTPRFTARLVEAGWCFTLSAGDALLLPSPGWDDCCWHGVFALGRRPSLAHSYGIFTRRAPRRGTARARVRAGREAEG